MNTTKQESSDILNEANLVNSIYHLVFVNAECYNVTLKDIYKAVVKLKQDSDSYQTLRANPELDLQLTEKENPLDIQEPRRTFLNELSEVIDNMYSLLSEKNLKYGDSALNPSKVFSKCDPIELINVRIDDKLSRIKNASGTEDEDPEWDLIGYLILKRIAVMRKRKYN